MSKSFSFRKFIHELWSSFWSVPVIITILSFIIAICGYAFGSTKIWNDWAFAGLVMFGLDFLTFLGCFLFEVCDYDEY